MFYAQPFSKTPPRSLTVFSQKQKLKSMDFFWWIQSMKSSFNNLLTNLVENKMKKLFEETKNLNALLIFEDFFCNLRLWSL